MNLRRIVIALVAALTAALGLVACADSSDALAAIADGATVVDVRTPAEFDSGHLDGALNVDVSAPHFSSRISELPKDAVYVVYCRSGNRSAAAVEQMEELGFTDVIDGGAYSSLS
ncbi:rhodanese-like domain-containing protein [Tessaracoccus sp. OS52]|uniref:rhodanese-like domain-containing protein n=1 Tax=Tessaracoccus sp. OS52 TaxID=2886691 RepID=UPI001D0FC626|nr:rhodanese-like domain-containing protein [Tessaracoccus sp. OS52]MCC2591897.1 rhodanese-like domain-containing protein [Tessaracoccus sp. OS52]